MPIKALAFESTEAKENVKEIIKIIQEKRISWKIEFIMLKFLLKSYTILKVIEL